MDPLKQSLERAFIDQSVTGTLYDPKLIINQPENKEFLLTMLQDDIDQCEEFFFSTAFITESGLDAVKVQLADLHDRGLSGRLITSTYLYFNSPTVFYELLKIPNLEVRISKKSGFHSKGYLFKHKDYHSLIIGSSNLTMSALKMNYEWNIRLASYDHGEIIHQMKRHMEEEWVSATPLTKEWITDYNITYQTQDTANRLSPQEVVTDILPSDIVVPNKMQERALRSIQNVRDSGENRALVISATGTGKTYLSAFDVLNYQPKRFLFIVHREQILNSAMHSYKKVLREDASQFGIFSGNQRDVDAKYLFATINMISKPEWQEYFGKDYFDYILIDEVHRAGAKSYQSVIDYFEPDFLMGMTATPERTDGLNIYEIFDYNIAYEIRLQEALEEDMLSPFHYFGVTDYEHGGESINETTDLKYLVHYERVNYLIEKINYYGITNRSTKGLIFCSSKKEAWSLADSFTQKGYKSIALTGEDSQERREEVVAQLEEGVIRYIFTVDIFNEGIDIPKVNQVIMLRNTQSSIVFIQQLGRGLRKHESKEFVTIIDFIGNYKNNYLIPVALSGDNSGNKNGLRQDVNDTHYISGLSAINFEQIAKERIYESINAASLDSMKVIDEAYYQLKNRLGRIPLLTDFYEHKNIDPEIIANKSGTYYDYLVKKKEIDIVLPDFSVDILKFVTREIALGQRLHELILINYFIDSPESSLAMNEVIGIFEKHQLPTDMNIIENVLSTLSTEFYVGGYKKTYQQGAVITTLDDRIAATESFKRALSDPFFVTLLMDLIKLGALNNQSFDNALPFTAHQRYRRRDTLRMLTWKEQMVDQNIGGYARDETNRNFVIFITLNKGDNFQGALMAYEDKLVDQVTMHWFTKSKRTMQSPEVQILYNEVNDWNFYVFAKKSNDDDSKEFYYLGEVKPVHETIKQTQKVTSEDKHENVVHMDLKFKNPIDHRLFKYLTSYEDFV
ncbi:DUF3427 domain-containing protein [Aerococcaceae bacterium DSM 111176]|nr:DUF3427 domain-containing protein [Aerococcaceae bacterium DSM 111176]